MMAAGRSLGSVAMMIVLVAPLSACASTPAAVPASAGFSLVEPAGSDDLAAGCQDSDRTAATRCLVEGYLPILRDVFSPVATSRGIQFTEPTVILDDQGGMTACGELTAPAYCPSDTTVVIPMARLTALGDRAPDPTLAGVLYDEEVLAYFRRGLTDAELATSGAYAGVIATVHEYSHHVQNLLGAITAYQADPGLTATQVSRQIELEADCMTGWVAGHLAATGRHTPTLLDDWAAVTALTEIGDDFRDPTLTDGGHGTVEQRAVAWLEGHVEGAMGHEPYAACTTIAEWAAQSDDAAQPSLEETR